jgi:hypothetical protein
MKAVDYSIAVLGSSVGLIRGALSSARNRPPVPPAKNSNLFRPSFAMLTGPVLVAKSSVDPVMVLGFEECYGFSM